MAVEVRVLDGDDWPVWRDLRLRALAESPQAFGSTFAREQAYDEGRWRDWIDAYTTVGYVDRVPVAIGAGFEDRPGSLMVVSMWTDPTSRGLGVGGAVLEAVVAVARAQGRVPHLFVMQANPQAARLYERHGFVRSGVVEEHGGRLAEQLVRRR